MALSGQGTKSLSSATLVRGVDILRSATMSLESDPQYTAMKEEFDRLVDTQLHVVLYVFFDSGNHAIQT